MLRKTLLGLALLISAPLLADQMTVIADGVLLRRGDVAWLKVSSQEFPLQFATSDLRTFALTLNNRSVHVEGTLETIPKGRAGEGMFFIRANSLTRNEGGYGYTRGRGYNYTDTLVVPRRQTGPIPSRPYPRY